MLMLAMSRSPGSAFVVEIDISLRAEFIVSSRIVLDWMESMVVAARGCLSRGAYFLWEGDESHFGVRRVATSRKFTIHSYYV